MCLVKVLDTELINLALFLLSFEEIFLVSHYPFEKQLFSLYDKKLES